MPAMSKRLRVIVEGADFDPEALVQGTHQAWSEPIAEDYPFITRALIVTQLRVRSGVLTPEEGPRVDARVLRDDPFSEVLGSEVFVYVDYARGCIDRVANDVLLVGVVTIASDHEGRQSLEAGVMPLLVSMDAELNRLVALHFPEGAILASKSLFVSPGDVLAQLEQVLSSGDALI
jgi:hypothetical protein